MKEARAELVRIDGTGEAHPIGTVASQRMRARAGAYRILPAPGHVVFMRYTGEDGRRDAEDGAIVRLAGEVTTAGTMCDVLALLAQTGWRGELVTLDSESSRSVFFDQGNVVGAQTSVEEERLGMVLYKYGAISMDEHELVMNVVRTGRRYGESAVELGLLTQERVYDFITKQTIEVVFATFGVSDGTFFFLDGFDDSRLASRHTISANALLMDGVTRLDEMRYFRQKIPSGDHIPHRVEERSAPGEEFQSVYAKVDGHNSVSDIGRETGIGEFETTKAIFALVQSKHVTVHPPRVSGGPAAIVATANSALVQILQRADAAGKGTQVRENVASFAAGAGVYEMLFRKAGPDETGALDAKEVAENVHIVSSGADPENVLKQMLHEYVSFALFSAGAVLGSEAEGELRKQASVLLAELRPQA